MRIDFQSVDEYIGSQPEAVQRVLRRVRGIIRKAIPGAQEVISYKMPTYTLHGSVLLSFAVWTRHYSIYGATKKVLAEFQEELKACHVEKGTIRFPLSEPVPEKLIEHITKFRAKEIEEREKAKS